MNVAILLPIFIDVFFLNYGKLFKIFGIVLSCESIFFLYQTVLRWKWAALTTTKLLKQEMTTEYS